MYYKVNVPAQTVWNQSVKLIVSAGADPAWKTSDFTTADWSGRKDAYYFSVVGNTITQSKASDIGYNYSSGFSGVNWESAAWQSSENPNYIVAWKSTFDASNVYFFFLLNASQNDASSYIYSAYDIDGPTGSGCDANAFNGNFEAQSCYYPFKEVGGVLECRDGEDSKNWIQSPVVKNTYSGAFHPVVHGVIKSDYDYVEMMIPKESLGTTFTSSTTTIDVNHSWKWNNAGQKTITVNN